MKTRSEKLPSSSSLKRSTYALLVVTALLTLAGFAALFSPRGVDRLLERPWADRLAAMSDEEAAAELERIAALGDTSFRPLAAALASPRERVARTAFQMLDEKLNEYRRMPVSLAEAKLAQLVDALHDESEGYGPMAARMAAQLAGRAARWRFADDSTRRDEIIAAAETILRAAPRGEPAAELTGTNRPNEGELFETLAADGDASTATWDDDRAFDLVEPVPGGGIRPEPSASDDGFVAPPAPAPELPAVGLAESDESAKHQAEAPSSHEDSATPISSKADLVAHRPSPPDDTDERRTRANERTDNSSHEPALYAVLRQLASSEESVREAAETELLKRGFNDTERWVARRSVDGDPEVRRQLAETLPRLTGINAVPWLLWLSRDDDSGVRREAMAVLATTSDPELRSRVERLADQDRDPNIRKRLGRVPERENLPLGIRRR